MKEGREDCLDRVSSATAADFLGGILSSWALKRLTPTVKVLRFIR